jgi:hypothetical protein
MYRSRCLRKNSVKILYLDIPMCTVEHYLWFLGECEAARDQAIVSVSVKDDRPEKNGIPAKMQEITLF